VRPVADPLPPFYQATETTVRLTATMEALRAQARRHYRAMAQLSGRFALHATQASRNLSMPVPLVGGVGEVGDNGPGSDADEDDEDDGGDAAVANKDVAEHAGTLLRANMTGTLVDLADVEGELATLAQNFGAEAENFYQLMNAQLQNKAELLQQLAGQAHTARKLAPQCEWAAALIGPTARSTAAVATAQAAAYAALFVPDLAALDQSLTHAPAPPAFPLFSLTVGEGAPAPAKTARRQAAKPKKHTHASQLAAASATASSAVRNTAAAVRKSRTRLQYHMRTSSHPTADARAEKTARKAIQQRDDAGLDRAGYCGRGIESTQQYGGDSSSSGTESAATLFVPDTPEAGK
jgi:hypothetical protein